MLPLRHLVSKTWCSGIDCQLEEKIILSRSPDGGAGNTIGRTEAIVCPPFCFFFPNANSPMHFLGA